MKIKRITKPTIQQFAEERDLTMIVEQTEHQVMAHFEGVSVSLERPEQARGYGSTEAGAIQTYVKGIQGQVIIYHAPGEPAHISGIATCPEFAPYVADPAPEQQAPKTEHLFTYEMAGKAIKIIHSNGQIIGTVDGALAVKIELAPNLEQVFMTTVGFSKVRLVNNAAEIKCMMMAMEMVELMYPNQFKDQVGEL